MFKIHEFWPSGTPRQASVGRPAFISCDLAHTKAVLIRGKPLAIDFSVYTDFCACATMVSKQWLGGRLHITKLLSAHCPVHDGLVLLVFDTPIPSLPALRRNRFSRPICRCHLRDEVKNSSPIFRSTRNQMSNTRWPNGLT